MPRPSSAWRDISRCCSRRSSPIPTRRIGELPLLTEAERHQLLVAWNDTATDYPKDRCIHQLFETQARRTPDAVAVVCDDRQLTYAELNARANQLAHQLTALGVGPEVLVGICLERSLDLIVGLLGILKAGGAYVPLDPSYPTARVAFMLSDTHAPVLVTQQALLAQLPPFDGHVLCLDRDATTIAAQPDTNPPCQPPPRRSRTSCTPPARRAHPRAWPCVIVALRAWCATPTMSRSTPRIVSRRFPIPPLMPRRSRSGARWPTVHRWSSFRATWRWICRAWPTNFERRRVSTMFLTTALFNEVVRARADSFVGLKQLLFGGEAVDPHWVGECLRAGGPQRLLHVYGPTECTTFATWHLVEAVAPGARTIPIGRPIANTVTYVLDQNRQPVPIGVAGELYVGGDGAGARLLEPAGTDDGEVCAGPVLGDAGGADVSHGGSGAVPGQWRPRVSGPLR